MENEKKIIGEFIAEAAGMDEIAEDLHIFDEGIVNSLFAIELMTFLEREFSIKIRMNDLDIENFQSVNNIYSFIESKRAN